MFRAGFVFIVGFLAVTIFFWRITRKEEITLVEVTTGNGQQDVVTLPDGSRVTLNENSKLTYPAVFIDRYRLLSLEGEAFFDVAADSLRSFRVQTGRLQTMTIGTSFNVRSVPGEDVVVTVVSGRVRVINESHTIPVPQNYKVTYRYSDHILVKDTANIKKALSWISQPW